MTDTHASMPNYEEIDYSNDIISDAELKLRERKKIKAAAGDSESIQGSIFDSAQITMLALGQLLIQLKAGKSIEDIIATDQAFAACIEFAEKEASGEMKVPFKYKPEGQAMEDIVKRTHAVAELYS